MFKSPIELSDIEPKALRDLFIYWNKIRGEKSMPSRKDFRPSDVPRLLPHIVMVDVEQDSGRYLTRLVGTETVKAMGIDLTGRYVNDVPQMSVVLERYQWIVENKTPYIYTGQLAWSEKSYLEYFALGLPLSDDDKRVDIIMWGLVYYFPSEQRTRFPIE
ncbi:PAS domain-containing protein [Emcibacter nanhaiensis]|uniref:PAS domain-containing protein n=1 Tax=Emcibacter nanhaiensis TaxID=1505037 RepID=A0A501PB18_9PROT|nr:PAS domain-containing protein [Emcibacter nanhaiensis]TPD57262.1 PAS domain-containing protein [Emcibacter nanhaiensis]